MMWEQNETASKREFPKDTGPTILGWCGRLGDDPELGIGMVNEGDGMACGGGNGPTAARSSAGDRAMVSRSMTPTLEQNKNHTLLLSSMRKFNTMRLTVQSATCQRC